MTVGPTACFSSYGVCHGAAYVCDGFARRGDQLLAVLDLPSRRSVLHEPIQSVVALIRPWYCRKAMLARFVQCHVLFSAADDAIMLTLLQVCDNLGNTFRYVLWPRRSGGQPLCLGNLELAGFHASTNHSYLSKPKRSTHDLQRVPDAVRNNHFARRPSLLLLVRQC